jgi:ribulose 1,5-bisphosphate synthetase/thiazole synthase
VSSFLSPINPLLKSGIKRFAITNELTDSQTTNSSVSPIDAVVVGAGPAGLLSAVMLAKKHPHVSMS